MDNKLEEFRVSPLKEVADIILPLIRNKYPNQIMEELTKDWIAPIPEIEKWEVVQEIQIHDPRKILHEEEIDLENKISIRRIQTKKPVYKEGGSKGWHFNFVKIIEVLKEYSYDEWDKGLVWND